MNLRKFNAITPCLGITIRLKSSKKVLPAVDESKLLITNRNPRNLERMRIARKPVGYAYDKKNVEFWNK